MSEMKMQVVPHHGARPSLLLCKKPFCL